MIPKIIHLCWLSGDEYPDDIKKCINSWKTYLPDYEIWVWDTKRFNINSTFWTKEAFEKKKYAFAADYIRLYALYKFGGIYLDSDILVYKNFDDLLSLPYFIGEDYLGSFEAAVIGAEKHCPWIKEILKYYDNRHFVNGDQLDMLPLPDIFSITLKNKYKFKKLYKKPIEYSTNSDILNVFNKDFFNSRNRIGIIKTSNSYCAHNYKGSWVEPKNNFKEKIKLFLPKYILNIIFAVTNRLHKKKLTKNAIPYTHYK